MDAHELTDVSQIRGGRNARHKHWRELRAQAKMLDQSGVEAVEAQKVRPSAPLHDAYNLLFSSD